METVPGTILQLDTMQRFMDCEEPDPNGYIYGTKRLVPPIAILGSAGIFKGWGLMESNCVTADSSLGRDYGWSLTVSVYK